MRFRSTIIAWLCTRAAAIYKIKEELQNETRLGSKQMLDERRQVLEVVNKANSMMQKESERISNQFSDVQKGIGEMKGLAGEVGSLKKILSNVKRRGILGKTQLENILSDVLSPSRYKKDVAIKENSRENVEFATFKFYSNKFRSPSLAFSAAKISLLSAFTSA